jgi:hypothetical protein
MMAAHGALVGANLGCALELLKEIFYVHISPACDKFGDI